MSRTAILLTRKHGKTEWNMDPRSAKEGSVQPLWDDFRGMLGNRSHPEFAEVRYHDDKPARTIRFEKPIVVEAPPVDPPPVDPPAKTKKK